MNYRIREESFQWGTAFYPECWSEEYQEWVVTTGGSYPDLKTAQEAIDLLQEFYDNSQSMAVPSEWLMDRAQKLLEEWN